MLFADDSRGRPFSKDPAVIEFGGRYLMYYSLPPFRDSRENDGWRIGIAASTDLDNWRRIGEITPLSPCDRNGLCSPGALVLDGHVHLFYQTYGNQANDAICHAISADGLRFFPNRTNPIFSPTGNWTCGRAIDADVIAHNGLLFLYFSPRDPDMRIQMAGVASAPLSSDFSRNSWTQRWDAPILYPELAWEGECIEASALCRYDGKFYMFYAGAYNNWPQQIGCAVSSDGIRWTRISDQPILPNGEAGAWNSSESGHPYVFEAADGTYHLFFQGNNDQGQTWYLSRKLIRWKDGFPHIG
jgi:beta-1,2-mannobiose phosphorylase / 1,2-beta-oligomannan phosphorylase